MTLGTTGLGSNQSQTPCQPMDSLTIGRPEVAPRLFESHGQGKVSLGFIWVLFGLIWSSFFSHVKGACTVHGVAACIDNPPSTVSSGEHNIVSHVEPSPKGQGSLPDMRSQEYGHHFFSHVHF